MLDEIKAQGYKYSTLSGITVAVSDAKIPESKWDYVSAASDKVDQIESYYQMGMLSSKERSRLSRGRSKTVDGRANVLIMLYF